MAKAGSQRTRGLSRQSQSAEPPGSNGSRPSGDISIRGVAKTFSHKSGRFYALRDLDLTIGDHEFVSIIGSSGCGKSTLLRLVAGLMDADEGEIDVGGLTPAQARAAKHFGFVPQDNALLPWRTVLDNVKLLSEVNRRQRAADQENLDPTELLESVGLGSFLQSLPKELSGGMRQRVSLVRAFSLGAPILLMDEPFAALDEFTREALRFQLLNLWDRTGNTVIFITHNIEEAVVLSDRVAVMSSRPGRIIAEEVINLPRPREVGIEETEEFRHYVSEVKLALRDGGPH